MEGGMGAALAAPLEKFRGKLDLPKRQYLHRYQEKRGHL